jgi:hypothetical protein
MAARGRSRRIGSDRTRRSLRARARADARRRRARARLAARAAARAALCHDRGPRRRRGGPKLPLSLASRERTARAFA